MDPNKLESFVPMLGLEVTPEGYIRDVETKEIQTTDDGTELTKDEIGYLGYSEDEGVVLVRDDFSSIVSYMSENDIRD